MSTKKTFRSQFNKVLEVDTYKDGSLSIGLGENEEPRFRARYHFDPAIAPALCLAILEAAGVESRWHGSFIGGTSAHLESIADDLNRYIKQLALQAARKAKEAEEAAALEVLNKRRDELAVQYFDGAYDYLPRASYRHAIDRIIELEDKALSSGD